MSQRDVSRPERVSWTSNLATQVRAQATFPFRPQIALQQAQTRRLRRVVAHAQATVPYYRERLARLGPVVQRTVGAFDVNIIASSTCERATTSARVMANFARVFGPEIVEFACVDAIDRTTAGKFRPVLSLAAQARQHEAPAPAIHDRPNS